MQLTELLDYQEERLLAVQQTFLELQTEHEAHTAGYEALAINLAETRTELAARRALQLAIAEATAACNAYEEDPTTDTFWALAKAYLALLVDQVVALAAEFFTKRPRPSLRPNCRACGRKLVHGLRSALAQEFEDDVLLEW